MQLLNSNIFMVGGGNRSVVMNGPEFVRSSLLPFFNNAADDLTQVLALCVCVCTCTCTFNNICICRIMHR